MLLVLATAVGLALATTVAVQVNAQGENPSRAPLENAASALPIG